MSLYFWNHLPAFGVASAAAATAAVHRGGRGVHIVPRIEVRDSTSSAVGFALINADTIYQYKPRFT